MKPVRQIAPAFLLLLAAAGAPAVSRADDAPEVTELQQDQARQALRSGLILPLEKILVELRKTVDGDVIEIELEMDDGHYVYEIEVVRPDGRLVEIKLDAKTGAVLDVEDD